MTTRLGPPRPVAVEDAPDTEVGQRAESTWVKKILILSLSVAGGIALWATIWAATDSYSMPKWLCIVITTATYFLISYLIYKGINYVKSEISVNYPSEILIAVCVLCILFQLVNNYLREDNFTSTGKPQIQEKIVPFKPGQPSNSGLVAQLGDTVQYINPTATFKVPGKEKFHDISATTEHVSTGFGSIVIYGSEKEGYVQIKVIPKRT